MGATLSWKRALYLTHRWAGIVLCLVLSMWFATGVVMMYVPFPNLDPAERFAGLEAIDGATVRIGFDQALSAARADGPPQRVRMTAVLGRPAYHFLPSGRDWITVFADTGERLSGVTPAQAMEAAGRFRPGHVPVYLERLDIDQWTVSGQLRAFRPLHRVSLDDAAGTELYVSDRTGEVVRDTRRSERAWNWLGANLHWIYPLVLVRHRGVWHEVVVWLSVAGTLLALSGLATGLLRWRFAAPYRDGRRTPYRGWMRWHHLLGLTAGVLVLTWVFSGLMSMNPWGLFPSKAPAAAEIERYRGGALAGGRRDLGQQLREEAAPVREVEWLRFASTPYLVLRTSPSESLLYSGEPPGPGRARLSRGELRNWAGQLQPTAKIAAADWLTVHDAYWYARENLGRLRPLPMLRVRFDDPSATWYHIDPATGQVLERLTRANRVQRWLYNGLHSFDFPFLVGRRPAWDLAVLLPSLAGFALCITGVVVGWRRLRRRASPPA